jgi:hypothetical protein
MALKHAPLLDEKMVLVERKFHMKIKSLISVCIMVLAVPAAGLAWAGGCPTGGTFPAQNEASCTAAGGTFSQIGSLKKCVVTGEPQQVTCERPTNNPFSATIASTTTFTRQGNECTVRQGPGEILACFNSQGHQTSVNACADKGCLPE